jgi:exopolysaccharide biosynthesis glucuronosyltransferase PssE
MIFVTIGSSEPFDRLLRALEGSVNGEALLVQRGSSQIAPRHASVVDFMTFDDFIDAVRRARVTVTHAGVGSVLAVISLGKRPVVVPRLRRFGEAVDDHQLPFARRLHEAGLVVLVEDLSQLKEAIAPRPEMNERPERLANADPLAADLRSYLRDEIGPPSRTTAAEGT